MVENLATLGESPIRDDSPAGESVKYDSDFETMKAEIEKLDSVTTTEDPDWRQIITLSEDILGTKSKDILVASYYVAALVKERGYAGLRDGLAVYQAILKNFWADLFPPARRMRARVGAIQWLMERLPRWLSQLTPSGADAEAVRSCQEIFGSFFDTVRECYENDSPGMGDVKRAIDQRVMDLPAEKSPEPEPAAEAASGAGAAAPTPAPRPAAPAPAALGDIESPQDAMKALTGTGMTLRTAATVLRKANPLDPLPYRVIRFASWLPLKAAPPSNAGETQLPPPRPQVIDAAASLTAAGDWANLLDLGEGRTGDTPFWLDASRHTATALAGMGPGHEAARQTVMAELAALLQRVPGLLDLAFKDGVPFADDQTKLWIEAEVLPLVGQGGGGGAAPEAAGGGTADELVSAKSEARKLLAGGKFAEAMAIFQHGTTGADSRRDRFRWKLALAEACSDAGQTELAMHQLESLDSEAEQFNLDEWEPPLCTGVVVLLYKCQKKLLAASPKGPPEAMEAAKRTYARLCRIDPVAAMELK